MSITLENHNNNNLRITFPVHGLDSGVMPKEALAFSSGPVPLFLFKSLQAEWLLCGGVVDPFCCLPFIA